MLILQVEEITNITNSFKIHCHESKLHFLEVYLHKPRCSEITPSWFLGRETSL